LPSRRFSLGHGQEAGLWKYKIGSVIKGENIGKFREGVQRYGKNPKGLRGDAAMVSQLKNCFAGANTINTTAKLLGMDNIIDLGVDKKTEKALKK
jgi:hypothetical protein